MAEDNKDDKGKTSTAWTIKDETLLIETLVRQKIAGNWGDNNPKKRHGQPARQPLLVGISQQ